MKKIVTIIVIVAIIAAGIVFIPKLVHTCDACEKFFVGTGYEPNIVADLISDTDQIICKECAQKQHAIALALGKSIKDYKRDLF